MIDFENLFATWPEGVVLLDESGHVSAINQHALKVLGYSDDQLLQADFKKQITMPEGSIREEAYSGNFERLEENPGEMLPQWWLCATGESIELEARYFQSTLLGDNVAFVLFNESLDPETSPFFLRKLAAFPVISPQPLAQISIDLNIEFSNDSLSDLMIEYGFDDFGQARVFAKDWQTLVNACFQNGTAQLGIETSVDDVVWQWDFHPILDQSVPFVIMSGIDITARIAHQRSLEAMNRMMSQANDQKSRFISAQNRQMNTPLNELQTHIEMLQRSNLDTQQSGWIFHLSSATKALHNLVQFSEDKLQIDANKLKLRSQNFNPRQLVVELLQIMSPRIDAKALNYYLMIEPTSTTQSFGDAKRIQQVLALLLDNAIQYTESGLVLLRLQTLQDKTRAWLRFSITDTGKGMNSEQQEHLFNKAFNHSSSLHSAKYIVKEMGGHLHFKSQNQKGSTFTLDLPCENELEEPPKFSNVEKVAVEIADPMRKKIINNFLDFANIKTVPFGESDVCFTDAAEPVGPRKNYYIGTRFPDSPNWTGELSRHFRPSRLFKLIETHDNKATEYKEELDTNTVLTYDQLNLTVMVVDDNATNLSSFSHLLKELGCTVIAAIDGDSAMSNWFLSAGSIQVILLDCKMPILDGYQVAQKLRTENYEGVIIGLTERRFQDEIDDVLRSGMTTCITKPLELDDLYNTILESI